MSSAQAAMQSRAQAVGQTGSSDTSTNILLVCGSRPEIIKLAPANHARRDAARANVQWPHTAQQPNKAPGYWRPGAGVGSI